MTAYEDDEAAKLQRSVRWGEMVDDADYDERRVKQSIVHAREDIALLVSHLSSINKNLAAIRSQLSSLIWTVIIVGFAVTGVLYHLNH